MAVHTTFLPMPIFMHLSKHVKHMVLYKISTMQSNFIENCRTFFPRIKKCLRCSLWSGAIISATFATIWSVLRIIFEVRFVAYEDIDDKYNMENRVWQHDRMLPVKLLWMESVILITEILLIFGIIKEFPSFIKPWIIAMFLHIFYLSCIISILMLMTLVTILPIGFSVQLIVLIMVIIGIDYVLLTVIYNFLLTLESKHSLDSSNS